MRGAFWIDAERVLPFRKVDVFGLTIIYGARTDDQLAFVTIGRMPTDHIVALLIAERDKLNRAIEALQGTKTPAIPTPVAETTAPKKKRHISAATRRKMALGQKKRFVALKAAKT